jgi:hypothetical protein
VAQEVGHDKRVAAAAGCVACGVLQLLGSMHMELLYTMCSYTEQTTCQSS